MKKDKNEIQSIPKIDELVTSVSRKDEQTVSNDESMKNLELAKIIVKEILNPLNIDSLSSINDAQINDIVNARLLNSYYQIPEIGEYIDNFLNLKRSKDALLLKTFERVVQTNNINEESKQGFFNRILKR